MASTVMRLGASIVLAASAVGGPATAAHADTTPYEMPRPVPAGAGYESGLRAVADQWTTGRLAVAGLNGDGTTAGRGSDSRAPADGWDDRAEPHAGQGAVTKTTGKLFVRRKNAATGGFAGLASCSASVVQSANRSVVLTAGHCFRLQWPFDIENVTVENAVFIPGFDGSSLERIPADVPDDALTEYVDNTPLPGPDIAPHGVWPVTRIWLTRGWALNKNHFYGNDMAAFLVDSPGTTDRIQDVTGGQAVAFDRPRGEFVNMFGYPTTNRGPSGAGHWYAPRYDEDDQPLFGQAGYNGVPAGQVRTYDGRSLFVSRGDTTLDTGGNFDDILAQAQAPGSSGGPWFHDFDPVAGTGTLIGVTSHFVGSSSGGFDLDQILNPARPHIAGTHFAEQERAVFQTAASAPAGE